MVSVIVIGFLAFCIWRYCRRKRNPFPTQNRKSSDDIEADKGIPRLNTLGRSYMQVPVGRQIYPDEDKVKGKLNQPSFKLILKR